jgi:predicted RND superfamily exporter protein
MDSNMNATRRPVVDALARWIFGARRVLLALFVVITALLGWSATRLQLEAGFDKMVPLEHPYMQTFTKYRQVFAGGNQLLIMLRTREGDIFTKDFLDALKKLNDEVFYLDGIERASVTSLYSPNVLTVEVVEDGYRAQNVISSDFEGRPEQIERVRNNVVKSEWLGRIVANDLRGALVVATLMDKDPKTGRPVDVQKLSQRLEVLRAAFENGHRSVHVIGFAKSAGDIAAGAKSVVLFFALAFVLSGALMFWYSGSAMLTGWALVCALVPVVWLLGLLPLLGLRLDPMSVLVPFLIFSIGVSHAVQITNAWKLEVIHGASSLDASREAFRKLFVPGAMALLANAIGFLVVGFVKIDVVRELALTATLGVSLMIVTNKMLLTILLSYMKLSPADARRASGKEQSGDWLWQRLARLTRPVPAALTVVVALGVLAWAVQAARHLAIGDLGDGVPELRADSRYNQDVRVIASSFSIGTDLLSVIAEAGGSEAPCLDPQVMDAVDRFEFAMRQQAGVRFVAGPASFVREMNKVNAELNSKWRVLPDNRAQMGQAIAMATRGGTTLMNADCSALQVSLFTEGHEAPTIATLVQSIKDYRDAAGAVPGGEKVRFALASGNVGVMAATNEAVHDADKWVNLALFGSVALLCLFEFRSIAILLCILLPLALVTVMCNALMALGGIGLKVNTLPVVALGVGVGVDYGIYLFERVKAHLREGLALEQAFLQALRSRGTASVFTAVTMALCVGSWCFSPLKFQADMGVLLAFMFVVNVVGAIALMPALAGLVQRFWPLVRVPREAS